MASALGNAGYAFVLVAALAIALVLFFVLNRRKQGPKVIEKKTG
jgi:hypothetical protein